MMAMMNFMPIPLANRRSPAWQNKATGVPVSDLYEFKARAIPFLSSTRHLAIALRPCLKFRQGMTKFWPSAPMTPQAQLTAPWSR
jgi:hypothetical protein